MMAREKVVQKSLGYAATGQRVSIAGWGDEGALGVGGVCDQGTGDEGCVGRLGNSGGGGSWEPQVYKRVVVLIMG
jgi:hypothetical protein